MTKRNTILLVDDDASILMELIGFFKQDYELATAKNGAAAIERAAATLPDLILLDIIMPGKNGLDVLKELKNTEKTKDISVIIASGTTENTDERRGLELGAIDYIRKPFDETIVKLRIKYHMSVINKLKNR